MPLKHQFICPLPNGIHARPASLLEEVTRDFSSEIILANGRNGQTANLKSVLAIVGADIRHNDACELTISGPDEKTVFDALSVFLDETLPHCDDAPPPNPKSNGKPQLPFVLDDDANIVVYYGVPVVAGIGRGRIVQAGAFKIPPALLENRVTDVGLEWQSLNEALQKLAAFYEQRLVAAKTKIEAELFKAHRGIARDLEFRRHLHDAVVQRHGTAAGAIAEAEKHFSAMLAASESARLRERALDIHDVCFQLLRQIYGSAVGSQQIRLEADAVVVAESLTPGQFLALDRNFLKGLALAHAGVTSHTIILARSFGVPTLTGAHDLANVRLDNQEAVIDADAGVLLTNLTEKARRYYAMEQQRLAERQARIQRYANRPAVTQDGKRVEIGANIASTEEAVAVFAAGAEGVGLFRTEVLFFDRDSAPEETEQFETYCRVLAAAGDKPVIIRTLDIGGDKPLDYLNLPAEENPFLGYRGARIYSKHESLFRTQIRALVRASARGKLKLLLPMIATVEEARWVKKIISEEQKKCAAEKIPFDATMPVGAMIEVPAAAFAMNALCLELDFFSIGSNDLLQYFIAADRANSSVAGLYNPLQPAFLRLLKQITDAARANKKWIGLCGEIGSETKFLPLFVGLGLDEISVSAPAIASLKAGLAELKSADCGRLLDKALNCATADEVVALLEQSAGEREKPLIDAELVMMDSNAATKGEAIKQAVDLLYALGRTDDSRAVEAAVWQREAVFSTGFGHGFAIPHCKTDAVQFNSLVVLKLRRPIVWNSLDGQPVGTVIFLAMRETNSVTVHMKVFARLARQIMDENFRAHLEKETKASALCEFLRGTFQA